MVYLFGERSDDCRFIRVEETTLMLEGADHDRNLGSAATRRLPRGGL